MALADSSLQALTLAESVVDSFASRYQIDLLDLQWKNRWDIAFLLDVLEHIDNDEMVLEQVRESLAPDGLVFASFFPLFEYNPTGAQVYGPGKAA